MTLIQTFHTGSTLDVIVGDRQTRLSDNALVAQPHSGDGRRVAVVHDRIFVVWAERSPAGNGTPCWIAELGLAGSLVAKRMLGFANPAGLDDKRNPKEPDVHDQPQLIADDEGNVHILLGAHHGTLLYSRLRSSEHGIAKGWGEWRKLGMKPDVPWRGYTYPACVWHKGDLHIVARWTGDGDPYTWKLVYFTLSNQEHRNIVELDEPAGRGYAKFEQRLWVDGDKLMLSYQVFKGEGGRDAKPVDERQTMELSA